MDSEVGGASQDVLAGWQQDVSDPSWALVCGWHFWGGCVSSSGDVSNFVTVVGRGTSRVANNHQQNKALVSCECGK